VQLMLFGAVSGDLNPDYDGSVGRGRAYVLALSAAAAALFVAGMFVIWRGHEEWWRRWIGPRRMAWLALLSVAATSLVIIPTQRPRPSYLFALSLLLMALLATAAFALTRRWAASSWVRRMMAAIMVLLPLTVPGYWASALPPGPSSMTATYRRLKPFQVLIDHPTRLFLAGDFAPYVHNYLGFAHGPAALGYDAFDTLAPDTTLAAFLDSRGVGLLYLDTRGWAILDARFPGLVRDFVVTTDRTGWRMVGFGQEEASAPREDGAVDRCRWALFLRQAPGEPPPAFEPFPGTDQFDGWLAVDGFFSFEGPYPALNLPLVRWGLKPASRMALRDTRGGRYRLDLCGMTQVPNQHVTVKVDGKRLSEFDLPQGAWPQRSIPFDLPAGRHEIELDYSAWESPAPTIDRTVLFKRLRITREREGGDN